MARRRKYEYKGKTVAYWAKKIGMGSTSLYNRLAQGWNWKKALNTPLKGSGRGVTIRYKKKSIPEWARELGIKPNTIYQRVDRGWTLKKAITTPVKK